MTQPKKSHHRKPIDVAARARERAEYFFLVYEQLGPNRTIKRLWGLARGLGIKTSLPTLERYSQRFGWQARILERAARHESAAFQDIQKEVDRMNAEHASLFVDIGALAKAGVMKYQEELHEKVKAGLPPTLEMDLPTIARLAQSYQYGERLARGLATSKAEVIVEVLPPLVKDMFAVFLAVNVITNDPPELVKKRESEFIQRGDQVLIQYYGKTTALPEGRGPNE
jgi:hypothetical protein